MKTFKIEAQFIFTGTISIPAVNEDAAREMIETGVGMCMGGDIHTHHEDADWEFGQHPELQLYEVLP
jgi:hypothetical protein